MSRTCPPIRQPIPQVESEAYSGPERRSGKHSPYGDELFRMIRRVEARQETMMADLTNLKALLTQEDVDLQAATSDVEASFAALQQQISGLEAGNVSQADIDALMSQAQAHDTALQALDAAAKTASPTPAPAPTPSA